VRVGTPLGEFPFEFRRVERRDGGIAVVGAMAGLESTVILGPEDLRAAARRLALPLAATAALLVLARARR
jgi:hypothetical protein